MMEIKDLTKIYRTKERDFIALKNVSVNFEPGEFIAILGESGSGKSTFLNMISGVDAYTEGTILFNGKNTSKFSDKKWREIRNHEIGFIFQRFNLIDHLTVMENIILPLILTGSDKKTAEEVASKLLVEVELDGLEDKLASELSGGQRQRVAIARTIIINPTVILADEPTGALDSSTGLQILSLLQKFAPGRIIIMVTHDEKLAYDNATRVIRLFDGEVISDENLRDKNKTEKDVSEGLLSHRTKITRRNKKMVLKQYPFLEGTLNVGEFCDIPLTRKYVEHSKFTKMISKKNYKQKIKINRRILMSFVISLALLLIVNIIMKNIADYNFNLFNINNNYQQYLVTDYDDSDKVLSMLDNKDDIVETGYYYEHFTSEMYLVDGVVINEINNNALAVNTAILSPKLVSLPKDEDLFYLNSEIIAGNYPTEDNEILVSSEFLLARFLNFSMNKSTNQQESLQFNNINYLIGKSLYICGETIIPNDGEDVLLEEIDNTCFNYKISGILNSYYKGINYAGNVYLTQNGYDDYLYYLENDMRFTRVSEYYDEYIYFYLSNYESLIDMEDLSSQIGASVHNEQLGKYLQTSTLQKLLNYIYIAIFASLIIISGTININIVASSVASRTYEIGIYSCIGVSKKNIRNMFIYETMEIALRIVLFTALLFGFISLLFRLTYSKIVVDLTNLSNVFGKNEMYTSQMYFTYIVIASAILFLFISVLIPSYKASNMKAIDALRSE